MCVGTEGIGAGSVNSEKTPSSVSMSEFIGCREKITAQTPVQLTV